MCLCGAAHAADAPARPAPAPPRPRLGASAQRNENVAVYQIDNYALKESNIRVGTRTTLLPLIPVEVSHFAAEHGQPATDAGLLGKAAATPDWHADIWQNHQNSVFNARTFFQAGPVQPSRRNHYGFRGTGSAGPLGVLTLTGSQRKIRGMVNGNVLVPLAGERTPLATDPAVRAMVQRFLNAYPRSLPNRPDFDTRALNTNAPQHIDEVDATARLDRDLATRGTVSLAHTLARQRTDAFQLVAGQNPDMDIHSHRSRLSWRRAVGAATEFAAGVSFQRTASLLAAEPNAAGPKVRIGFQIEELGPDSQFPIHRAQNSFRYGALATHRAGGHSWLFGSDFTRFQLNGIETNNQRGYFQFTNNFGRTAIENFLLGAPSLYEVTLGDLARGYRTSTFNIYFADRVNVHPRVQLYYGLRYNAESAPGEVQRRDIFSYGCDCNNFSPRVSIAWQAFGGWVVRAGGTVSFAAIPPVTYQQVRNNLPRVRYLQLQNPDLLNPLRGLALEASNARSSPTYLSSDLVSSYAWQYSLTLERKLLDYAMLRIGYVGSRSFKLMNGFVTNRAVPVPGIPLTTATVDQRRADARFYEVKTIANGGIAWFDAGQIAIDLPLRGGLLANATYTFSKALDEGADFAATAANRDIMSSRPQSQFESYKDRKGLSNFDSLHALQFSYTYDMPAVRRFGLLLNGWQLSGATLFKSGTPLTLFIGSDAPGFGNVDGSPSDRPNIVDPSIIGTTIGDPNTSTLILRRDRFDYIHPGEHRGSVGRNVFRKAGIANFNAAISKQWLGGDRREWRLLLRAEAYNLTNTPQFDEPQRNLSSPAFGKITNTLNDGRVLQIGLRLVM